MAVLAVATMCIPPRQAFLQGPWQPALWGSDADCQRGVGGTRHREDTEGPVSRTPAGKEAV